MAVEIGEFEPTDEEIIESLRADNLALARRCDELMAAATEMAAERGEDVQREKNLALKNENEKLTYYVEIMQRRLNNINHELNSVREEIARV